LVLYHTIKKYARSLLFEVSRSAYSLLIHSLIQQRRIFQPAECGVKDPTPNYALDRHSRLRKPHHSLGGERDGFAQPSIQYLEDSNFDLKE